MKKFKIIIMIFTLFLACSCSIKKDDLENADIYTTTYPINYLTEYLYGEYANINSIYPKDCDLETFKLTDKQVKNYAKADLFIYNGLSNEKEIAKTLLNKNKNLLIIDVSYGLTANNNIIELWLNPNNYLMLAKNIKDNLQNYLTSKYIIDQIDKKYNDFEEKISIMDANIRSIANDAKNNNKETIVVSNNGLNYLQNYGFNIIDLSDENNLKENKLNNIKSKFDNSKYTYILCADFDKENDTIKDLVNNHKAKLIEVNTLTISLDDDYFNIMTSFVEDIKTIVS